MAKITLEGTQKCNNKYGVISDKSAPAEDITREDFKFDLIKHITRSFHNFFNFNEITMMNS